MQRVQRAAGSREALALHAECKNGLALGRASAVEMQRLARVKSPPQPANTSAFEGLYTDGEADPRLHKDSRESVPAINAAFPLRGRGMDSMRVSPGGLASMCVSGWPKWTGAARWELCPLLT